MKVLYLFLLSILFFSCSDDEPSAVVSELSGSLSFNGSTFEIAKGFILIDEEDEDGTSFQLFLSENAATFNEIDSTSTFLVVLDLLGNQSSLQAGDYSFSSTIRNIRGVTVLENGSSFQGSGGRLRVSGSGNSYTLDVGIGFNNPDNTTSSLDGLVQGTFTFE